MTELLTTLAQARERFMELVAEVRPELHRYCARMTGSVFDGEDVVQDTLARAYFALSELGELPPLRPWLFRIAHNSAIDFLRRAERKRTELVAEPPEIVEQAAREPDPELVEAAISVFASLPPVQRSAIVLKDVLGHSLEETAATMGTSVLAIKGALSRARANIASSERPAVTTLSPEETRNLRRYADLFNARDWDGLRSLLGEEAQVDLVSRWQRRGEETRAYYTRYAQVAVEESLRAVPGLADGVPVVAILRGDAERPAYFLRVEWSGDHVAAIRDFYFVPWLAAEAVWLPA